jgi:hypothetical protein
MVSHRKQNYGILLAYHIDLRNAKNDNIKNLPRKMREILYLYILELYFSTDNSIDCSYCSESFISIEIHTISCCIFCDDDTICSWEFELDLCPCSLRSYISTYDIYLSHIWRDDCIEIFENN